METGLGSVKCRVGRLDVCGGLIFSMVCGRVEMVSDLVGLAMVKRKKYYQCWIQVAITIVLN